MHQEFLLTTAEVSGALLGFVGVVLVIGRRSQGVISNKDRSGLFHLVYGASGALFFSLTMYLVLVSFETHDIIWRVGSALTVLYALFGVTKAIREGQEGDNRLNPFARHLLSAVTFSSIALNATIMLGFFLWLAPFAYGAMITIMIAAAVSYFVPFVLGRQDDAA